MFDFDVLNGVIVLVGVLKELDESLTDVFGGKDGVVLFVLFKFREGEVGG